MTFSWTGVLNKGVLCHFTIYKISWFFLSFSQDWTKWEILPPRGKFCFNSSGNIFFNKGWTYSNFFREIISTELLQKRVAICFCNLTIWFVGSLFRCIFLPSLLLLRLKMLTGGFLLWFPALSLVDCFFLAGNPDKKSLFSFCQPLWTSIRFLSGLWCYLALASKIGNQTVPYCFLITMVQRY